MLTVWVRANFITSTLRMSASWVFLLKTPTIYFRYWLNCLWNGVFFLLMRSKTFRVGSTLSGVSWIWIISFLSPVRTLPWPGRNWGSGLPAGYTLLGLFHFSFSNISGLKVL